ncbi:superoxide dismutase family protein [Croceicoccus sp. F390]|uniref:Superoxide dismutase family protein n=1 Tax=Croceicoccus esteveae TaxID=3075597 RepID=A0ABU2ZED9_9SPHN|nr:superoxide dismutase family protein [Croceicoccus sp. F390]MDT0574726.1 superoxide dismutase family protein [Croceicoccus sp. F390]
MKHLVAIAGAAALLTGCATTNDGMHSMAAGDDVATATLRTADGTEVGKVMAMKMGDDLHVQLSAYGMPAGTHGAHIHQTGRCDAPDFTTAGDHWNPTNQQHGTMDDMPGAHAGDLPNLVIGTDGSGSIDATTPEGSFAQLLDQDGAAFIVHRDPDDMRTDPSGNAGPRIACGVFSRS